MNNGYAISIFIKQTLPLFVVFDVSICTFNSLIKLLYAISSFDILVTQFNFTNIIVLFASI